MGENPQKTVAEIEIALLDHPQAIAYFNATFGTLDFSGLFQWLAVSYYNAICK